MASREPGGATGAGQKGAGRADEDPGSRLHPELTAGERRRLFFEGIELFNRGEHFESHESWEEIWRSTTPEPRDLFQGLIQVAAGLHHWLERGKAAPAARVMARGRRRLEPLAPVSHGLDLEGFLTGVERWEHWLTGPRREPAPPVPRVRVVEDGAVR